MPHTICPVCGELVCHPIGGFFCHHTYARNKKQKASGDEARAFVDANSNSKNPIVRAVAQTFRDAGVLQDVTETLWLVDALAGIEIKTVLEIGAWCGGTSVLWERLFGAKVISIDNNHHEPYVGNRDNLIVADSQDPETVALVKERGDEFDMVFIDGDHSAESVKQDFLLYSPFCRPGGVIVFHDILWDRGSVGAFFDALPGDKKSIVKCYGLGVLFS
jgi:predicted O-methyltransferase YrrM